MVPVAAKALDVKIIRATIAKAAAAVNFFKNFLIFVSVIV